jgi:hypothetical protein
VWAFHADFSGGPHQKNRSTYLPERSRMRFKKNIRSREEAIPPAVMDDVAPRALEENHELLDRVRR